MLPPTPDTDPARIGLTFEPFTWAHLVTAACCILTIVLVCHLGRRLACRQGVPPGAADPAGQMVGLLGLLHWGIYQVWWNVPPRFGIERAIPLQLCDLAGVVGGLALLSGSRFLTTTIYFWGVVLSTQAFITPIIKEGPALTRFWLFWESHTFIVGAAAYVVWVRGYRPRARDLGVGVLMTVAYAALVFPLNLALGTNFGYIGRPNPDPGARRTLVDALGPWPWRVLPLTALAMLAHLLAYVPWLIAERCAPSADEAGGARPPTPRGQ
ncbi:MAG TPA: TIGR02206 family membrane protein [Phycisphaerales bacterium]|nr:TIGR02206 family membrane protein [Phycisphaerales bacterium]